MGVRLQANLAGTVKQDLVPRFNHRWLNTREPYALSQALEQIQQHGLPTWDLDVHAHRQWLHHTLHTSLDELPANKTKLISLIQMRRYERSQETNPASCVSGLHWKNKPARWTKE